MSILFDLVKPVYISFIIYFKVNSRGIFLFLSSEKKIVEQYFLGSSANPFCQFCMLGHLKIEFGICPLYGS